MGFQTWWLRQRLARIDRRLKLAHAQQKEARKEADEAASLKKKGKLAGDDYDARIAKIEAQKTELTRKINALMGEQKRIQQALEGQAQ